MADQPLSPREKILSTKAYNHSARRWLYIGVGSMLVCMLGLWGYATFTQLSFFDWSNTREAYLYQLTKEEFSKLVKDNPILNEKIKDRLQLNKNETASSTTSVGTTTFPIAPSAVAGTTTLQR